MAILFTILDYQGSIDNIRSKIYFTTNPYKKNEFDKYLDPKFNSRDKLLDIQLVNRADFIVKSGQTKDLEKFEFEYKYISHWNNASMKNTSLNYLDFLKEKIPELLSSSYYQEIGINQFFSSFDESLKYELNASLEIARIKGVKNIINLII